MQKIHIDISYFSDYFVKPRVENAILDCGLYRFKMYTSIMENKYGVTRSAICFLFCLLEAKQNEIRYISSQTERNLKDLFSN